MSRFQSRRSDASISLLDDDFEEGLAAAPSTGRLFGGTAPIIELPEEDKARLQPSNDLLSEIDRLLDALTNVERILKRDASIFDVSDEDSESSSSVSKGNASQESTSVHHHQSLNFSSPMSASVASLLSGNSLQRVRFAPDAQEYESDSMSSSNRDFSDSHLQEEDSRQADPKIKLIYDLQTSNQTYHAKKSKMKRLMKSEERKRKALNRERSVLQAGVQSLSSNCETLQRSLNEISLLELRIQDVETTCEDEVRHLDALASAETKHRKSIQSVLTRTSTRVAGSRPPLSPSATKSGGSFRLTSQSLLEVIESNVAECEAKTAGASSKYFLDSFNTASTAELSFSLNESYDDVSLVPSGN